MSNPHNRRNKNNNNNSKINKTKNKNVKPLIRDAEAVGRQISGGGAVVEDDGIDIVKFLEPKPTGTGLRTPGHAGHSGNVYPGLSLSPDSSPTTPYSPTPGDSVMLAAQPFIAKILAARSSIPASKSHSDNSNSNSNSSNSNSNSNKNDNTNDNTNDSNNSNSNRNNVNNRNSNVHNIGLGSGLFLSSKNIALATGTETPERRPRSSSNMSGYSDSSRDDDAPRISFDSANRSPLVGNSGPALRRANSTGSFANRRFMNLNLNSDDNTNTNTTTTNNNNNNNSDSSSSNINRIGLGNKMFSITGSNLGPSSNSSSNFGLLVGGFGGLGRVGGVVGGVSPLDEAGRLPLSTPSSPDRPGVLRRTNSSSVGLMSAFNSNSFDSSVGGDSSKSSYISKGVRRTYSMNLSIPTDDKPSSVFSQVLQPGLLTPRTSASILGFNTKVANETISNHAVTSIIGDKSLEKTQESSLKGKTLDDAHVPPFPGQDSIASVSSVVSEKDKGLMSTFTLVRPNSFPEIFLPSQGATIDLKPQPEGSFDAPQSSFSLSSSSDLSLYSLRSSGVSVTLNSAILPNQSAPLLSPRGASTVAADIKTRERESLIQRANAKLNLFVNQCADNIYYFLADDQNQQETPTSVASDHPSSPGGSARKGFGLSASQDASHTAEHHQHHQPAPRWDDADTDSDEEQLEVDERDFYDLPFMKEIFRDGARMSSAYYSSSSSSSSSESDNSGDDDSPCGKQNNSNNKDKGGNGRSVSLDMVMSNYYIYNPASFQEMVENSRSGYSYKGGNVHIDSLLRTSEDNPQLLDIDQAYFIYYHLKPLRHGFFFNNFLNNVVDYSIKYTGTGAIGMSSSADGSENAQSLCKVCGKEVDLRNYSQNNHNPQRIGRDWCHQQCIDNKLVRKVTPLKMVDISFFRNMFNTVVLSRVSNCSSSGNMASGGASFPSSRLDDGFDIPREMVAITHDSNNSSDRTNSNSSSAPDKKISSTALMNHFLDGTVPGPGADSSAGGRLDSKAPKWLQVLVRSLLSDIIREDARIVSNKHTTIKYIYKRGYSNLSSKPRSASNTGFALSGKSSAPSAFTSQTPSTSLEPSLAAIRLYILKAMLTTIDERRTRCQVAMEISQQLKIEVNEFGNHPMMDFLCSNASSSYNVDSSTSDSNSNSSNSSGGGSSSSNSSSTSSNDTNNSSNSNNSSNNSSNSSSNNSSNISSNISSEAAQSMLANIALSSSYRAPATGVTGSPAKEENMNTATCNDHLYSLLSCFQYVLEVEIGDFRVQYNTDICTFLLSKVSVIFGIIPTCGEDNKQNATKKGKSYSMFNNMSSNNETSTGTPVPSVNSSVAAIDEDILDFNIILFEKNLKAFLTKLRHIMFDLYPLLTDILISLSRSYGFSLGHTAGSVDRFYTQLVHFFGVILKWSSAISAIIDYIGKLIDFFQLTALKSQFFDVMNYSHFVALNKSDRSEENSVVFDGDMLANFHIITCKHLQHLISKYWPSNYYQQSLVFLNISETILKFSGVCPSSAERLSFSELGGLFDLNLQHWTSMTHAACSGGLSGSMAQYLPHDVSIRLPMLPRLAAVSGISGSVTDGDNRAISTLKLKLPKIQSPLTSLLKCLIKSMKNFHFKVSQLALHIILASPSQIKAIFFVGHTSAEKQMHEQLFYHALNNVYQSYSSLGSNWLSGPRYSDSSSSSISSSSNIGGSVFVAPSQEVIWDFVQNGLNPSKSIEDAKNSLTKALVAVLMENKKQSWHPTVKLNSGKLFDVLFELMENEDDEEV